MLRRKATAARNQMVFSRRFKQRVFCMAGVWQISPILFVSTVCTLGVCLVHVSLLVLLSLLACDLSICRSPR